LIWDQSTHQGTLTIDGRPVPHVRRVNVAQRLHDCEVVIYLDEVDFELDVDTSDIEVIREE
jgi:hypothetical protein